MKNFSVKTADFDSLSISGESPIVQSDLGTAPNQIPLNKDLGSLAYMNAPQIEDLNVDALELREIAAELSETAVDVFVYDTRKDSDGGAWRGRTQHTSWYNEELNTATRGGRREFPAVAVIVLEAYTLTIYDGDDPDLPMWMVFNATTQSWNSIATWLSLAWESTSTPMSGVSALNSKLVVTSSAYGVVIIDFIDESHIQRGRVDVGDGTYALRHKTSGSIALRNDTSGQYVTNITGLIVNRYVNDVAMTVLPNAPIDGDTGLPIPTIAVATDGGVSVIRDDGSVTSSTTFGKIQKVSITQDYKLYVYRDAVYDYVGSHGAIDSDLTDTYRFDTTVGYSGATLHTADLSNLSTSKFNLTNQSNDIVVGQDYGISKLNNTVGDFQKELYNVTTSSYNTGWMPGDIKLATLSDTKIETVGVDESTELVTNGTFDTDLTGWTQDGTDWSVVNGEVVNSTSQTRLDQAINCIPGRKYVVSFDITQNFVSTQNGIYIRNSDLSNYVEKRIQDGSTGSFRLTFVAADATHYIRLYRGTESGTLAFDNISVKQTGELITNGTFDDGTTGWTNNGMATFEVSSAQAYSGANSLHVVADSNGDEVIQNFPVEAGKAYVFTAAVYQATTAAYRIRIGDVDTGSALHSTGEVPTHNGTWKIFNIKFTATGNSAVLSFAETTTANACDLYIDAVSVRLAEDDRSVNDNGLQIFGEIDKTPVAPGADLVAYSGFSSENYLMQPYNSDLDFGTGDFCVMGWFKSYTTSNAGIIYNRRPQSSNINGLEIGVNTDGTLYVYTIEDSQSNSSGTALTGKPIVRDVWNNFCAVRSGQTINLYVNGALHSSTTDTIRDLTNTSAELCLGIYGDQSSVAFEGEISLIRASTTVPTDEQIAKIYRDEKVLFQDGAQATLYGTSDAVTALAYDDKTELLHVGTSGGRSDFSGLRRINNTTTAVTTSISASNNLIAEQ